MTLKSGREVVGQWRESFPFPHFTRVCNPVGSFSLSLPPSSIFPRPSSSLTSTVEPEGKQTPSQLVACRASWTWLFWWFRFISWRNTHSRYHFDEHTVQLHFFSFRIVFLLCKLISFFLSNRFCFFGSWANGHLTVFARRKWCNRISFLNESRSAFVRFIIWLRTWRTRLVLFLVFF